MCLLLRMSAGRPHMSWLCALPTEARGSRRGSVLRTQLLPAGAPLCTPTPPLAPHPCRWNANRDAEGRWSYEGWQRSVKAIERAIAEQGGPRGFDGLMGFSQVTAVGVGGRFGIAARGKQVGRGMLVCVKAQSRVTVRSACVQRRCGRSIMSVQPLRRFGCIVTHQLSTLHVGPRPPTRRAAPSPH